MDKELPPVAINRKSSKILNILLVGKHGGNFDTMIIANINMNKGIVNLLSVPRDIFINGRKINSAYVYYGMGELKRQLGIVTGLHIDHYMIIDMYAFIEVVDLMGGINVYLDRPLIDPTYKTFDNGEWGTLNYSRGEHYLSGVQALRIARSRHTSSDFSRSERQQVILKSVKKKVNSLGINSINTIPNMIKSVLNKTVTDMNYKTVLTYILRFKNYSIKMNGTLSTSNVLKSKKQTAEAPEGSEERCYKKLPNVNKTIEIECAKRYEGQYILLPIKDWNAVRWYVKNLIN